MYEQGKQLSELQARFDQLLDERAYAPKDQRQLFIFCEDLLRVFASGGAAGVREVLVAWGSAADQEEPSLVPSFHTAKVFMVPRWRDRLVV